ncbi:hypothetical protein, partial [Phenylobacterium sp.]|uniref:hypothetical protein n=1 Tax=Phenylobacterium sp. TaxID=1871053 RepID=UPI002FC8FC56
GLIISDNIVAGFADMKARIALKNTVDVTLTNNQATDYIRQGVVEVSVELGNLQIAVPTDRGLDILSQWSASHPDLPGALTYVLDGRLPWTPQVPGETTHFLEGAYSLEAPLQVLFDFSSYQGSMF